MTPSQQLRELHQQRLSDQIERDRYGIETYLDLSTAHITEQDAQLLDQSRDVVSTPIRYSASEYGWFVVVPYDDVEEAESAMLSSEFSSEFLAILSFARSRRARIVRFDRDADGRDGFPVFEW